MSNGAVLHYPDHRRELLFLTDSLRCMFEITDQYIEVYNRPGQPNSPFTCNESATLSVFAGGVWRSDRNNFVIQEFRDEKQRNGVVYKGSSDIWFRAIGWSCYAEAKQETWPPLQRFGVNHCRKIIRCLESEADSALNNARNKIISNQYQHVLGLVFVVPRISITHRARAVEYRRRFHDLLNKSLQEFTDEGRHVVLRGSYFRDDLLAEQAFGQSSFGKGRYAFPGVEVLFCESRNDR